jgi:hypothetical protein
MDGWMVSGVVGLGPYSPDAPRPLLTGPLCPITIYGSPIALPKFQMAPRLTFVMFSGPKKKQPRYTCLIKAKASHRQRIWGVVSSSAPHFLHNGLSDSHIRWRCLLRVICLVRKPVTTQDHKVIPCCFLWNALKLRSFVSASYSLLRNLLSG